MKDTTEKSSKKLFKFIIPASWQVAGEAKVMASSLEKAIEIAAGSLSLDSFDANYVDDSFEINEDCIEEYPENQLAVELCKIENTSTKDLPLLIGSLKQSEAIKYLEEKISGKKPATAWEA
jgi:hypothetical protein